MKTSGILTIAAAGALLAGCADVSDITKISGTVKAEAIDEVNVTVPEMSIDTLVPVKDGKFYLEVPANPVVFGAISAASYGVNFIPDGTEIDVVIAEESSAVSRKSGSVQSRFVSYQEKVKTIMNDFNTSVQAIMADTSISDTSYKLYDLVHMLGRMVIPYSKFILQGIRENRLNNRFHITEENVEAFATFVLYGAWGMIYNNKFTGNGGSYDLESILKITDQLFY